MGNKHTVVARTVPSQPINTVLHQHGMEGVIVLAVELKYQQPSGKLKTESLFIRCVNKKHYKNKD